MLLYRFCFLSSIRIYLKDTKVWSDPMYVVRETIQVLTHFLLLSKSIFFDLGCRVVQDTNCSISTFVHSTNLRTTSTKRKDRHRWLPTKHTTPYYPHLLLWCSIKKSPAAALNVAQSEIESRCANKTPKFRVLGRTSIPQMKILRKYGVRSPTIALL